MAKEMSRLKSDFSQLISFVMQNISYLKILSLRLLTLNERPKLRPTLSFL